MPRARILNEDQLRTAVIARGVEDIEAELRAVHDAIRRRAYERFESHGLSGPGALDDWLWAERELFWQPRAAVVERDDGYEIEVALPGARAEDLDVQVTDRSVLVKSVEPLTGRDHGTPPRVDELPRGRAFRRFDLPASLDRDKATATLRDGVLRLTLPVRRAEPARAVPVAA